MNASAVAPITYRDVLRRYSDLVGKGLADDDLTPRQRRLVVVMVNLASNHGSTVVYYPPTDATRDDAAKYLGNILWDARALVFAASPSADKDIDTAAERAVAIIRGC